MIEYFFLKRIFFHNKIIFHYFSVLHNIPETLQLLTQAPALVLAYWIAGAPVG